jgi:hypothetical protein
MTSFLMSKLNPGHSVGAAVHCGTDISNDWREAQGRAYAVEATRLPGNLRSCMVASQKAQGGQLTFNLRREASLFLVRSTLTLSAYL